VVVFCNEWLFLDVLLSLCLALKWLYCLLYQSSLSQPQMMVVTDLDDVFLPLPDDLLVNLVDSRHVVESFLDSLPTMFHDNVNVESALGPALKAAFMVMV
jgi:protein transport protein SEC24